jgi:hypothetical protein
MHDYPSLEVSIPYVPKEPEYIILRSVNNNSYHNLEQTDLKHILHLKEERD